MKRDWVNKKREKKKISASNGWTNFLICKTTAVGCHLLLVYYRDQKLRVKTINHPTIWLNEQSEQSIVLLSFSLQITKNDLTLPKCIINIYEKRVVKRLLKIQ